MKTEKIIKLLDIIEASIQDIGDMPLWEIRKLAQDEIDRRKYNNAFEEGKKSVQK